MNSPTESENLTLAELHEAVKLGDVDAAEFLAREFSQPMGGLVPVGMDTTRAQRYKVLANALIQYGQTLELANLDRVLPLPPARPPRWNGEPRALLAMAQALFPVSPKPVVAPKTGRAHVPAGHVIALPPGPRYKPWYLPYSSRHVEQEGYWQAVLDTPKGERYLTEPWYFACGEYVPDPPGWERLTQNERYGGDFGWHFRGVAVPAPDERPPTVRSGVARLVEIGFKDAVRASVGAECAQSGVWFATDHYGAKQHPSFNGLHLQAFVLKGQPLPDPTLWSQAQALNNPPAANSIMWCLIEPWELDESSLIA